MACNIEDLSTICHTVYVQPDGSGLCGPYAVAHLASILPEESILAFRIANNWPRKKITGTTTKNVWLALMYLGYKCGPRMRLWYQSAGEKLPNGSLLCVRWVAPGTDYHGTGHWVYYNRGYVVCSGPDRAGIYKLNDYINSRSGVYISYLEVTK